MTQTLLLEIGTEDLPARYVQPLAQALAQGIGGGLGKRGVGIGVAVVHATPRRIAVSIDAVEERQPDQQLERKGPQVAAAYKDGQPTPAALGFAKSCGVDIKALKQENGYLVFRNKQKGRKTFDLLPEIFAETLKSMDELVPKRMRWGAGDETFVRPVQWLLFLFGGRIVPLQRWGLNSGRKTYGHRFHAPQAITVKTPQDYAAALNGVKVWSDFASRRAAIKQQVEAQAATLGGTARIDEGLLDEVTALVEWPVAISGRIEERFLQLPPEVVVATVETNQRYFTVFDTAGKLLPYFITVSNIESKDMAQVIAGNERVVRPRLTDALFFWEQDRKQPLEAYGDKLKTVTFQKDLGSTADKVARLRRLAVELAGGNDAAVDRAAALCKNDLVTRMVYEFPELQGLMGGYYARAAGEPDAVAQAVAEHYRPTQAGGPIPSSRAGRLVALADKLDTLAGIFAIGQKPTASKDPFALRRATLGALRIVVEGGLDLDLRAALQSALQAQPAGKRDDSVLNDLWDFLAERLRGYCLERGATVEQFEAVRATGASRPLDFVRRLDALRGFQNTPAAATLASADKRARNILRQSGGQAAGSVQTRLFEVPSEHALLAELERAEAAVASLRADAEYGRMLEALSALKEPVDAFFDGVMVMAENLEVRGNRLALLARLDAACREVADLSCLPG
jgi:glycyl-tRNA synthetase beta chain